MKLQNLSLRKKIIFSITGAVILFLGIFIFLTIFTVSKQVETEQYKMLRETAKHYANKINSDMIAKKTMAQSMAIFMSNYNRDTANRNEIINVLQDWIKKDENLVGTFIGYEPDAFDGNDKTFMNEAGHDETGRFIPSWYRYGQNIDLFPLVDYEKSNWYTEPRRTKKDYINQAQLYENILLMGYISPIIKNNKFIGIAGVDVKLDYVDKLVSGITVLETGYATMMSNAGFFISAKDKSLIGKKTIFDIADETGTTIFNEIGNDVKNGNAGIKMTKDPITGKDSVFIYEPIQTGTSCILLIIPEKEITAGVDTLRNKLLIFAIIIISLMGLMAYLMANGIAKPIIKISNEVQTMATGDLTKSFEIRQNDEVGKLAASLNKMTSSIGEMIRKVASGVNTLSSASTELATISEEMSLGADQASEKTGTVAAAAEEMSSSMASVATAVENASANLSIVATASEEMTSTIKEVAKNTDSAHTIVATAVQKAETASKTISELGSAAEEINQVTETITDISEQTNLLALNATIEAARAGEAGKGFAVVAQEIKQLAELTARATRNIREKIKGIQNATSVSVESIGEISGIIDDISRISSTIATAVEEQAATTREIAENAAHASQGMTDINDSITQSTRVSEEITQDIAQVNRESTEITKSSSTVNLNAKELLELAETLKNMVDNFKVKG